MYPTSSFMCSTVETYPFQVFHGCDLATAFFSAVTCDLFHVFYAFCLQLVFQACQLLFPGLWPAPFFVDSSAGPGSVTEPWSTFFKGSVAMTFLTDSSARKHYTFTEPWPPFFKGSMAMTFLMDSSARTHYRATTYLFQVLHGHLNLLQVLLTLGQLCVHLASQLDQQTDNKKSVCSVVQKWQCSENSYIKSVWKRQKKNILNAVHTMQGTEASKGPSVYFCFVQPADHFRMIPSIILQAQHPTLNAPSSASSLLILSCH